MPVAGKSASFWPTPSCQGYSTHGKQEDDPRNFLFEHFIRLVSDVRPKWVLMENVTGLLAYRGGHFKNLITQAFSSVGYDVSSTVLTAADYGVPQLRQRIFFLGTQTEVPVSFPEPTHAESMDLFSKGISPYVTVEEAIGDLPLMHAPHCGGMSGLTSPPRRAYSSGMRDDIVKN